ncbi:MAG: hypothetical protein IH840_07240 [Candidatus Heimdallarchaeota archaeon]|nr:hypothetical protein [Candidatus Heimdallarchaeota archaeon]
MSSKIHSDYLIIVSKQDQAGMNIKSFLIKRKRFDRVTTFVPEEGWPEKEYTLEKFENTLLLTLEHPQIYSDYLIDYIDTQLIIFASKHFSAAGQKALLVHTTGVWGTDISHGGRAKELALAPSLALTHSYFLIKEKQKEYDLYDYWVGLEATHHGPTALRSPAMFIETGGSEIEWNDLKACELLADVILDLISDLSSGLEETLPAMIGIGGGHYAPTFIRRLDAKKYLLGHIAPKFVHQELDNDLLRQAWDKTIATNKIFLIDKKGTKGVERRRIIEILDRLELPWTYS